MKIEAMPELSPTIIVQQPLLQIQHKQHDNNSKSISIGTATEISTNIKLELPLTNEDDTKSVRPESPSHHHHHHCHHNHNHHHRHNYHNSNLVTTTTTTMSVKHTRLTTATGETTTTTNYSQQYAIDDDCGIQTQTRLTQTTTTIHEDEDEAEDNSDDDLPPHKRRRCSTTVVTTPNRRRCHRPSDALKASETNLALANQLIQIIRCGDLHEMLTLLRKTKPDLNVFVDGQTALHYSLLFGRDLAWCKELVSHGADPNLVNIDGWHPIHLAAFLGLSDTLCYLVKCNSNKYKCHDLD